MDYFSAYSLVLFSLYAIVIRVVDELLQLHPHASHSFLNTSAISSNVLHVAIAVPFIAFFAYHVHFLTTVYFDYGYNMRVNVLTGCIGSALWLLWCAKQYVTRKYVHKLDDNATNHIKYCVLSIVAMNACLSLELMDFEPLFFTLDAHALWHASTIFFPFYWFR